MGSTAVGFSLFLILVLSTLPLTAQGASPESDEPTIAMDEEYFHVITGGNIGLTISFSNAIPINSFNLLISCNAEWPQFLYAEPLGIVADWEYFNYQYSRPDTCGGDCPVNVIRLVGIADLPNSEDPGDVFLPEGEIVRLTFHVPEICHLVGLCHLLDWTWFDCEDNSFVSLDGDSIFLAADIDTILPESDCLDPGGPCEVCPLLRFEDSYICAKFFCDRGDMNLNGYTYEIGDAVLFGNYFIFGPSVLHDEEPPDYYENRVLGSDFNDDGQVLTVADMVCLLCVISTGDMSSCVWGSDLATSADVVDVDYSIDEELVVSTNAPVDIGAAAFVFHYSDVVVGTPILNDGVEGITIGYSDQDGVLRVLVHSLDGNSIDAGAFDLFTVPISGEGTIELVEVQLSDTFGRMLTPNTTKKTTMAPRR